MRAQAAFVQQQQIQMPIAVRGFAASGTSDDDELLDDEEEDYYTGVQYPPSEVFVGAQAPLFRAPGE